MPGDFNNLLHSKRRTHKKLELNRIFFLKTSQILVRKSLVRSSSSDEATVSTAVAKFAPLTGKYTYKQLRHLPVRILYFFKKIGFTIFKIYNEFHFISFHSIMRTGQHATPLLLL
jgi:hypothetical protein